MRKPRPVHALGIAALGAGVLAAVALGEPTPVSGPVQVNPTGAGDQFSASVAMAPDGHFAVAYEEQATGNPDVLVRRFSADATPHGSPTPVNDTADTRQSPRLGMAADGSMVVAYERRIGGDTDIAAQRL